MKKTTIFLVIILIIGSIVLLVPKTRERSVYIQGALGTVSEVKIYHKSDKPLKECEDYIYRMDRLLSVNRPESEISRLNSGEKMLLSTETEDMLKLSMEWADPKTFNPFCGELIEVWDRANTDKTLPDSREIIKVMDGIYPPSIQNEDGLWSISGQKVNLGGLAKGYILDGISKILEYHKVESALVYLGGSIYAKGTNSEGEPWRIGIRNPERDSSYMGIVSVSDVTVTTSGDYERYFELDGKRYHHILDLSTGYPAESGLKSVTIISKDAKLGDYLSTKCFILGFDASKELVKEYGVSAIFITDDKKVFYSKELDGNFNGIDAEYSYETF